MSKVLVEATGAVRTITLNRPEKRNALDAEMLAGLLAAFQAEPPPEQRLTVLRANGTAFSAGLDLRERIGTLGTPGASPIEDLLHAIEAYPLPVVAVVQGDAIAGGTELALHCDVVVASTAARFGISLTQMGLAPTWFLAKKVLEAGGPVAAREIFLLGDPLPAARLHAWGMIARVAAPEEVEAAAAAIIERLMANAPLALRATKAMLVREMAFRDGVPHADVDALVEAARGSADAQEGLRARLEKRAARFTGA